MKFAQADAASWLKQSWMYLVLGLFILVGAGLRLYRADELMIFNGDQGRDVTIVERMIDTGQPTLLGPGSGAGHFRRGPAYYYLLSPALWLTGGEPLGGVIFISLVDLAAIVMVFVVGRALVGPLAGLSAACLYACAQIPVQVARAFSNPALLPFLTLLMLYALWRMMQGRDRYLLVLVGAWLIAWQLHDQVWLLMVLFAAVAIVFRLRIRISTGLLAMGLTVLLLSPFIWYEATHNAANLRAMVEYVNLALTNHSPEIGVGGAPLRVVQTLDILARGTFQDVALQVVWSVAVLASVAALVWRAKSETPGAQLLLLYACVPLLYLIWPGPIYGLNVAIVLPVPFLVVGYGIERVGRVQPRWAYAALAGIVVLGTWNAFRIANLKRIWDLDRDSYATVRAVVEKIQQASGGEPFVFEYIVETRNEEFASPYLYLMKRGGARLTTDARAMHIRVYNPAVLGDAAGGTNLHGVRVLAYNAPQPQGQNLLKPLWQVRGDNKVDVRLAADTDEIALQGQAGENAPAAIQRLAMEPNAWYLLRFECKGASAPSEARVFVQTLNAAGDANATFPEGSGYLCPTVGEWTQGAILFQTPPQTAAARIWLRNLGLETVGFRRTELQLAVVNEIR